jgi:phosphoglycerate dehydrogenase-like enzyme
VKALVTAELTEDGKARLQTLGYDVTRAGWGVTHEALDGPAYVEAARGASLLLTEIETIDDAVLDACPDLGIVGTARGGPVNVDIAACTERAVPVLFTPARNAESVADFTIGLILALVRGLVAGDRHLRGGGWHVAGPVPYLYFRGPELARLTLGMVGYGAVGRLVAQRAREGFGMRVVFHDPYVEGSVPLPELLGAADVVSLHCPRTPDTERLIRAETLAQMRPGAWLVNTAGGACVDETDLIAALDARRLSGAALDVFATEPLPPESGLRGRADVVLTPHLAGAADDVVRHHTGMLVGDVERIARGDRPVHCANPHVLGP